MTHFPVDKSETWTHSYVRQHRAGASKLLTWWALPELEATSCILESYPLQGQEWSICVAESHVY